MVHVATDNNVVKISSETFKAITFPHLKAYRAALLRELRQVRATLTPAMRKAARAVDAMNQVGDRLADIHDRLERLDLMLQESPAPRRKGRA